MEDFEIEELLLYKEYFPVEEIDIDFEFDAPQYYDFTHLEIDFDDEEAELWFETAPSYPPSPHVVKWSWRPYDPVEGANPHSVHRAVENPDPIKTGSSSGSESSLLTAVDDTNIGLTSRNDTPEDISKAKDDSPAKPPQAKKLNFMSPTVSHLAKQNGHPGIHCQRLLRSFHKFLAKSEKSSQNSCVIGIRATKRQKLEAGYLRKFSRLKHQALFSHKAPKKVVRLDLPTAHCKPNVTIPREPNLRTAYRAERHRSRNNMESTESEKSNVCTFRARPLNRKILKSHSPPQPNKHATEQPELQAESVSDVSPVSQIGTTNCGRVNSIASFREKLDVFEKYKLQHLNRKVLSYRSSPEVPVESFSKLSLSSDLPSNPQSPSNLPPQSKAMNAAKFPRLVGNRFECVNQRRMPSNSLQINRSLGIR